MNRLPSIPLVIALLVCPGSAAAADRPLDIPVPENPSAEEITSTEAESGDLQSAAPGARACDSAPQRAISLPADDGPHNDTYLEWWWWHGSLATPDGRRFAFTVTFAGKPSSGSYASDYMLTDVSRGTFHYAREPVIPGRPRRTARGFRLAGEEVLAVGGGGHDRLRFRVDGYDVDLRVEQTKPPVEHFGDGHVNLYCNGVWFYSRMRMRVTGTVRRAGRATEVAGTSVFDHQWGFGPATEIAHWDWLNLELDGGQDVFVVVVRLRRDGEEATLHSGSISEPDGSVTTLHRGDFSLTPTRHWRRDAGCDYPVEWDVEVNGREYHVRPTLDSTEVRALRSPLSYTLWPVYWDGETVVEGDGRGRGWLDMRGCPA